VTLVNTSGHFATTVYDPIPIYGARLSVPVTSEVKDVVSLRDGASVPFTWEGGRCTVQVDIPDTCQCLKVSLAIRQ